MLSSQASFCEDPDSKLWHLVTEERISSSSSSCAGTRHPEIGNITLSSELESKQEGGESIVSKANFGTFDQKHLRSLGRAFIRRLPFPSCTTEKGYILKLLDRTLEVDPSIRLSRITPAPIMTKWNRSNLSSLQEKLAIHTGSSSFSFKMFQVDEEREIPWEHQRQILLDFERIATYHGFREDSAAAAMQVATCYIVGFGTSPNNDCAIRYLRRAEELGHPMAILFGRGLQNILGGISTEIGIPYDQSVVMGFKEQTLLKSKVFELHGFGSPGTLQRFSTYGDFQTWLCGLHSLCLASFTSSWVTTIPPSSKMNLCECFIAMEDVTSIKRIAEWLPRFEEAVYGDPLLIQAFRKGNVNLVQILLDAGVDTEKCTQDGLTIYHFLFMLGEGAPEIGRQISKFAFTSGKVLYNHPCSRKYLLHPQWLLELEGSPLVYAITARSKVGVETLLEIGVDPTVPIYGSSKADLFCSDWTPIHLAIKYHSSDIFQPLLALARNKQQRATVSHPSQAAGGSLKLEARDEIDNGKQGSEFPCPQKLWGDLACSAAYSSTLERYAMHGQNHKQRLFEKMNALPLDSLGRARRDGFAPIMQAIDFSDIDFVETLLQLDPTLSSKHVYDPKISSPRALDIVKKLGEFQSAVVMRDGQGRSPLHFAVTGFSSTVAEWLIENGSSVHHLDQDGRTPLHYCGSAANVHLILNAKAQINCKDKEGFTSIQLVALAGLEDIARSLIERGADLTIAHYEFGTPLHCAVLKRSRSVVLLLLEHASSSTNSSFLDANSRDSGSGNTPLHLAARTSRTDIVRMLLNHGADPSIKNTNGLTPFHQCLLSSSPESVRSFLDVAGVPSLIHVPDANENTALHLAAKFARSEIIELLLDCGANVDPINSEGDTALNLAAAATHSDINKKKGDRLQSCKALYSHGATLLVENNRNMCAWDYALWRLDFALMGFLLEQGGPKACKYETLPDSQNGQYLLDVAINRNELAFVTLILSQDQQKRFQKEAYKRSKPTTESDLPDFGTRPQKSQQNVLAELDAWINGYAKRKNPHLLPAKTVSTLMSRISNSNYDEFQVRIANLLKYTSGMVDYLAIVALQSLIADPEMETEKLSIPRSLSDCIMSSTYSSQLDQVLDPSLAFNETRLKNIRVIVQRVLEFSNPVEDESRIGETGDLDDDKRLLSFLYRLNYGEVAQLEEELGSVHRMSRNHVENATYQHEERVPGTLQCFKYNYAVKLNLAMIKKDKSTLKAMFASGETSSLDKSGALLGVEPPPIRIENQWSMVLS